MYVCVCHSVCVSVCVLPGAQFYFFRAIVRYISIFSWFCLFVFVYVNFVFVFYCLFLSKVRYWSSKLIV